MQVRIPERALFRIERVRPAADLFWPNLLASRLSMRISYVLAISLQARYTCHTHAIHMPYT